MADDAILAVYGLTPTQVNAIGFGSEYSSLGDSYKLTADDVYREATLAALERKGYLGRKMRLGGHRWLTPEGLKVRQEFQDAHLKRNPEQYQG